MAVLANTKESAELLKAFSHPTRLAILQELACGPKCVNDMEELLPVVPGEYLTALGSPPSRQVGGLRPGWSAEVLLPLSSGVGGRYARTRRAG